MTRLIVLRDIWTDRGFTHYRPGDFIPPDRPEAEAWISSGAAKAVPEDYTPPVRVKAYPVSSLAGLPGIPLAGEPAGIGRVPLIEQRRRTPWRD